ncbi:MAG: porin [Betaproteobacteria bacterium]|nr:porin [Betaproteobacteria bacterium]
MQKKLMAIAVAGALGAPAVALAQASTVQIYGNLTYEYAIVDQGAGRPTTDVAATPGGSAIGFRGEEKLGGGLSAWFQCESSADVRGLDGDGFCTRNSAVGFKGAFGNLHFGVWDTPFKRAALGPGSVGAIGETGALGTSFVAWGGSGFSNAINKSNRNRWKRRERAQTYYESPNFGGFQVLAAFTPGNRAAAIDAGSAAADAVDGATNNKPRVWSLAGSYAAGPLAVGLGYERHDEFGATGAASDFDDRAWGFSASYRFGPVKVGGTYLDAKYETGIGSELKRKSWTLGVEWDLPGPHSLMAFYGQADDTKGNSLVGVVDNPAPCTAVGVCPGGTGAKDFSIGYGYAFSKRTQIRVGWHRTDNESRAFYKNGSAAAPLFGGEDQDGYGFWISHRF